MTAAAEADALTPPSGRPGLAMDRLVRLMSDCVSQMRIELGVTRSTRYGSVDDVRQQTFDLDRARLEQQDLRYRPRRGPGEGLWACCGE